MVSHLATILLQDFCREKNPALRSLSLKEFTGLMFGHCPGLAPFQHMLDSIYTSFNKFKQTVPTMGAILLNQNLDKVLLVRGFHSSHGWGFPKGKVAMKETDHDCAIREVAISGPLLRIPIHSDASGKDICLAWISFVIFTEHIVLVELNTNFQSASTICSLKFLVLYSGTSQ